jgi:hypothetical protein
MKKFVETVEGYFMDNFNDGRTDKKKVRPLDTPQLMQMVLGLDVKECMVKNARGGLEDSPGLDVCGKQYPLTNSWHTIVMSVRGQLDNYGDRVKEFDGEGVDWKALSHAIRITEQVLELCQYGKLTFPRPNARFLLDVKSGNVPLAEATAYLEHAFQEVDAVVSTSTLQERTPTLDAEFEQWKLDVLKELYGL